MSDLHDWRRVIDLSPMKSEIESLAHSREDQKRNYKTSRQWSTEATNLTGLKGEFAFSLCTGLPVDCELRASGDIGVDFLYEGITYDVKTTKFSGDDPMLLEMTGKRLIPNVYVLVRVDDWAARVVGWASRRQMRGSEVNDLGYGPRYCFPESRMRELGQNTIPPCVPSTSTDEALASQRSRWQLSSPRKIITLDHVPSDSERKNCFPHGPFEKRHSRHSQHPALYCASCGRFYGVSKQAMVPSS